MLKRQTWRWRGMWDILSMAQNVLKEVPGKHLLCGGKTQVWISINYVKPDKVARVSLIPGFLGSDQLKTREFPEAQEPALCHTNKRHNLKHRGREASTRSCPLPSTHTPQHACQSHSHT